MRPTTLAQYIGQQHLLAAGKPLPRAIEAGQLHSMILWGPPGTGKTTLAELIGRYGQADVERISASPPIIRLICLARCAPGA
ncbi:AAA family ATPase, partial [Serratia ureilytica]|nr:AAA family ATPase [Serratia ureilytica]